jgi:phage-related protein
VAPTGLVFYQEDTGTAPVVEWLQKLRRTHRKAYAKCVARIRMLAAHGHELRRPVADYLRDGVYELRTRQARVNYRVLYFFHGQAVAVLAHSLTKEAKVSDAEIERAIQRKQAFEKHPKRHTYTEEIEGA